MGQGSENHFPERWRLWDILWPGQMKVCITTLSLFKFSLKEQVVAYRGCGECSLGIRLEKYLPRFPSMVRRGTGCCSDLPLEKPPSC